MTIKIKPNKRYYRTMTVDDLGFNEYNDLTGIEAELKAISLVKSFISENYKDKGYMLRWKKIGHDMTLLYNIDGDDQWERGAKIVNLY